MEGAREGQLTELKTLGLVPDCVLVQSAARKRHWQTFARAIREGRVYPCFCSRKDVREALDGSASAPHRQVDSPHVTYSGNCRHLKEGPTPVAHGLPSLAWRFAVLDDPSGRSDFIVGRTSAELPADSESFAPAYHWACAVDDWDGNYRLLVRASDLAVVVPQHRAIMAWLVGAEGSLGEAKTKTWPAVFHTRLVTRNDGQRLEKRTQRATLADLKATGIDERRVIELFRQSWNPDWINQWAPGKVFGEENATMSLAELGLG